MGKPVPGRPDLESGSAASTHDDQPTVISNQPPLPPPDPDGTEVLHANKIGPGDRLGHYEVLEYIGGGGMARVYRAMDTRLARTVALKVLSLEQAADPETKLRFHNEAQSAAQLDHENIARVHYVGEDRGLPFIVFEFIEGTDIRALVEQKGVLPLAEAVSYTLQIAEALAHAASHNVVHRDIKPSNVLITPDGQVKVIDMGLARIQGDRAGSDLTASGVTLGTFDYISPEQARDPRSADVRSDIYSLGCAFFFMLTGRPPFPEGTVLQKLLKHQGDEPPDLRQFRPGLPDEVVRVVRRMLAKDPRRRYQDATELVEDLLALAEQIGLRPLGPGRTVWVTPREPSVSFLQRHLPWIAPIAALLCIVVLLDFFWSSPPGPADDVAPMAIDDPAGSPGKSPESTQVPAGTGDAQKGPAGGPSSPEQKPSDASSSPQPAGVTPSVASQKPDSSSNAGKPVPDDGTKTGTQPEKAAEPGGASAPAASVAGPGETGGLKPEEFRAGVSGSDAIGLALSAASAVRPPVEGPSGGAVGPSPPATGAGEKRTGILIVNGQPGSPNQYASLAAACSAASSGDVIELRYNGRRDQTPETPIRLANMRLTIRAGEGFQPVVVFRPSQEDKDPVKYPRSMFTVAGGELTLFDLAVELAVPRALPAESWSLFEPRQGGMLRLKKCLLTIRNASDRQTTFHPDVAFLRVKASPGADLVTADEAPAPVPPVTIELTDCVARGEAAFLRAEDVQPIRLAWNNGLLTTTERLLVADGGQRLPLSGEKIEIDLQHLTAVVRAGLCRLDSGQLDPYQLDTEIRCKDSIILADAESALVEQSGLDSVETLKHRFRWNGDWDFYQGFTVFWSIHADGQEGPTEQLTLDSWHAYWGTEHESMPKWGQVVWKQLPEAGKPHHVQTPADYALGDSPAGNPARRAARDGRDVGFQADLLPQPRPEAEVPKPPSVPAAADSSE